MHREQLGAEMIKFIYKNAMRLGAVICAVSLISTIYGFDLFFKGSPVIDVVFISAWVLSEYQWRNENGG